MKPPSQIIEQEPPLVDDGESPEIYVDGYSGSVTAGGMAKFPFYSVRYDQKNKRHIRKVVMTLTMPVYVVEGVHQAFGQFIEQVRNVQAGLRPD